jgi:DNA polymerase III subunit epsilon
MIWRRLWSSRSKTPKHPALIANAKYFSNFDQSKPINEYDFVSFDTELTGLNPKYDQIVSIGAVRIRNLQIVAGENFYAYVKPSLELPKTTTLIHQITPEQIKDAPALEDVLPDFLEFCADSLLVGHFVSLDMAFLNKEAKKILGGPFHNPCVDSMKLAQTHHESQRKRGQSRFSPILSLNLGSLARQYDLPRFTEHDALEDALQTAYLFLYLVKKLSLEGFKTLKDYYMAGRIGPKVF